VGMGLFSTLKKIEQVVVSLFLWKILKNLRKIKIFGHV
jgi:hypothetical protein